MDINNIEKLIKIIEDSNVKEFNYKDTEMEIFIRTVGEPTVAAPIMPAPAPVNETPIPAAAEEDEYDYITSPIVATFYAAPAPEMPAFVKAGDQVKSGQTLCILEAMKLMNEIPADFDCEIDAVLVSNEQRVEYGQPLFRVKRL